MINMNLVQETGEKRAYHIRGSVINLEIYKIPLDQLKYNIKNGRIASYISEYLEEHSELPDDYNNIVEEFIVNSNIGAFRKTKSNIEMIGQMEPAIVLSNGIVVDGNRRFTSLRKLYKDTNRPEFQYINAAILQQDSYTEKEIKTFELNLQHGREERVDYNPIEHLVDIYRDLVANGHEFEPEEYAIATNKTVGQIKKEMRIAQLLVEYLEFINKPQKFFIARELKLDGPLREIDKILRSKKSDESLTDEIKEYLFYNLSIIEYGDVTRIIRDLKPIVENKNKFEEVLDESEPYMDDLYDVLQSEDYINETQFLNIPKDLKDSAWVITRDIIEDDKLEDAQIKPLNLVQRTYNRISEIDIEAAKRMDSESKEKFLAYINSIEEVTQQIKEEVNVNQS